FYFDYHHLSRSRKGTLSWLEKWVFRVEDHADYLALLGEERLNGLKPQGDLFSPRVSFNL
ncbi:MAG: CoA transferase subunit A, partial [Deltaproteobacteria bacterium]|nr:CoA transferase subunit A [Deltaproteobacteria bacterium]